VFSAMKLVAQDIGRPHVSMDVGCHAFASFEPFSQGNTLLGYGMSLAAAAGVAPMSARRPVAVMGDGGFWHNGLLSGVASSLLNRGDGVLVIMKNGYASATGTQELISSPSEQAREEALGKSATHADRTIEKTLAGLGVKWLRTVDNYRVGEVAKAYREAMTTRQKGLKVIVAEGECQLERQRRLRPVVSKNISEGKRTVRVKYGVDEDTCTGDHSCIRLSGCPTLTVKENPDPLRRDPVATVIEGCVGCGLCGENAHAAVLCPSFYRAEVIQNPTGWDRLVSRVRKLLV
jgi:indolepyruvate ferredoxin oxidoreductase alpha subunit